MLPELKGQRCACVSFSRDKSLPGATCDCGHLACFHLTSADAPSPGKNRDQIELVKQRVNVLEQQAGLGGDHADLSQVVPRLSQLEETMDRNREELQNEIKGSYRNISAAWQLIEQLQRNMAAFEEAHRVQSEQLARAGKELQDLRNRNLELLETDEMLEERIEKLEGMDTLSSPVLEPLTKGIASNITPGTTTSNAFRQQRSSASRPILSLSNTGTQTSAQLEEAGAAEPKVSKASGSWTVHVSLLPSRELPFPFEKDTNAYKRCLSRGLQRMIAVEGTDGESFVNAVFRAFGDVLQGASWEPLQAKICDARKLEGLPMLRTLEHETGQKDYNLEFLRRHCAVCDADGRIQALYLGVQEGALSWAKIKQLSIYVEGLEASWEYDKYLDHRDDDDDGDSVDTSCQPDLSWPTTPSSGRSLKRGASEMQSTGLATGGVVASENEGPIAKKSRKCMPDMIEIR